MSAQFANQSLSGAVEILFVGDSADDAGLVRGMLDEAGNGRYELVHAKGLANAMDCLDEKKFQAIFFDGAIAESEGPDALARIRQYKSTVPVIVLTGDDEAEARSKMLKEKSHAYLAKKHLNTHLLTYAICSAIQTHALQQELQGARWREYQERRTRLLERLSGSPQAAVTAHNADAAGVKEAYPDRFRELSHRYGELMEMALAQAASAREVSDGLRTISEELGTMKAVPKDLLDIHGNALMLKSCGITAVKAEMWAEEGRLLLIEAMGYLASYYRNYSNYATSIIKSISPGAQRASRTATFQEQHVLT